MAPLHDLARIRTNDAVPDRLPVRHVPLEQDADQPFRADASRDARVLVDQRRLRGEDQQLVVRPDVQGEEAEDVGRKGYMPVGLDHTGHVEPAARVHCLRPIGGALQQRPCGGRRPTDNPPDHASRAGGVRCHVQRCRLRHSHHH